MLHRRSSRSGMEATTDDPSRAVQPPRIHLGAVQLQRFIRALPKPLRRLKLVQLLASITRSPYHRIAFQKGALIGNVRTPHSPTVSRRQSSRTTGILTWLVVYCARMTCTSTWAQITAFTLLVC